MSVLVLESPDLDSNSVMEHWKWSEKLECAFQSVPVKPIFHPVQPRPHACSGP